MEASCWRELARLCAAALELQGNPPGAGVADLLPQHVLELQPPFAPGGRGREAGGGGKDDDPRWPSCGVAKGLPQADRNMDPLRRALRASYVIPDAVLGNDAFGKGPGGGGPEAEGRQQLLEARSVEARLGMLLRALRRRRRSIEAALRAMKKRSS